MRASGVGFLKKWQISLSSFIRNTSCSSGWLRCVVQLLFGTLVVTSFILIVLISTGSLKGGSKPKNSRCVIANCRVICNEAPYYGDHEDDIINAASEVDRNCKYISLQLNRPTFPNSRIPKNWLSRLRPNVRELAIIGGNTVHITPHAFMSPMSSNIESLILESIEINPWESEMLIGLSSLNKIYIRNCLLPNIRKDALRTVDESLEMLDIKALNPFDPVNLTGSAKVDQLRAVDFSFNNFGNILGNTSFGKLQRCKVLFLNSCKITAIAPGTFDYLHDIEVLYLNNNYLVTVPAGIFNKIIPLHPRIALQENYWHCDCSFDDLRVVFNKGLLMTDPLCYYPDAVNGLTFSDFEGYCNRDFEEQSMNKPNSSYPKRYPCQKISKVVYLNGICSKMNSCDLSYSKNVIPLENDKCFLNRLNDVDLKKASLKSNNHVLSSLWIKPSFSIQDKPYSMIEMVSSSEQQGLGLIWYQSSCSNEVYCINNIPTILKIFNDNIDTNYTFCQFNLSTGMILDTNCVSYELRNLEKKIADNSTNGALILNICISLGCLICGAISVYALIQRNPSLLKGNKRVVFVKHKSIEALILPPQLPTRKIKIDEPQPKSTQIIEKQKIFLLPGNLENTIPENFIRSISTRSSTSNDVSYISPLQPTENQLKEWRSSQIVNQFENSSTDIDMSPISSISDRDSLPYYSFRSSERIYEVPK